jgi:hypothetical protein
MSNLYFPKILEVQSGLNCTIHAVNNALQQSIIKESDVNKQIKKIFNEFNKKRNELGRPLLDWGSFYKERTDGGYSIDDVSPILEEKGFFVTRFNYNKDNKRILNDMITAGVGTWVISGKYPRFNHSLAVRDGYVIESLIHIEPSPYQILERNEKNMWPIGFVPYAFFSISKTKPPKVLYEDEEIIEIE